VKVGIVICQGFPDFAQYSSELIAIYAMNLLMIVPESCLVYDAIVNDRLHHAKLISFGFY